MSKDELYLPDPTALIHAVFEMLGLDVEPRSYYPPPTMLQTFLILTSLLSLVTGSSDAKTVQQTPSDLIKDRGESAEITCSHNIQTHERIL
ncbi:hypothetical protein NFI96_020427, partial [Prochilodus magdalenae]